MRALTAILMVLLMGSAFGACGDDQEIRTAVSDLRKAWLAEDYDEVCDRLTRSAQREIGRIGHGEPSNCRRDVAARLTATVVSPRDLAEPRIQNVELDGDRAKVVALLGGTTPGEIELVKEDGIWKLDSVFGTTAPPPVDM